MRCTAGGAPSSCDLALRPGQAQVLSPTQLCPPWRLSPAANEWLPAAALAWPGVGGPGQADSWAGRAPLVKGNNPAQQDNRPFPGSRRDLISDRTSIWGRTPCSLGLGEVLKAREYAPSAPDANGTKLQILGK